MPVLNLPTPVGMEVWVNLSDQLHTEMVYADVMVDGAKPGYSVLV